MRADGDDSMYRPLTAVGAIGLTLLTFAVFLPLLYLVAAFTAVGFEIPFSEALRRVSADPTQMAASTVAGVAIALVTGKAWTDPDQSWQRVLSIKRVPALVVALSIVTGLALQFPLTELSNLSEMVFPISLEQKEFIRRVMTPKGGLQLLLTLSALVAIVPICEELLFRGLMLRGLKHAYGPFPALFVSSLLFGLSHFRLPTAILPATSAGFLLGLIALRTGSVWPSIALHAAVNGMPIVLSAEVLPIQGFNTVQERASHLPLTLLVGSSLTSLVAFALLMIIAKSKR
ncbi:MAG: CPBP family intramembrane metalloprotease [Deltaproteobacteria bacterium]|nr:CPBP family intramembrane metalloprotease [Deltaproteobacteria bacterium]